MPEISRFYGVLIRMYFQDHPPPHFHAIYAGHEAQVSMEDLRVLRGSLPPRALGLVVEWAALHRDELFQCWERAANQQNPGSIDPLP